MVRELGEYFRELDPCVVMSYLGIDAEEATQMRATLREKDVRLRVVKNSLSRIALREIGREDLVGLIDGPTAIASGGEDPIALAKLVAECAKGKDDVNILGGFCDGDMLSAEQVETFAKIPSREALYAQILGGIHGPLAGVAGMFASIQRSLVTALKAIADQKAEQQA